MALLVPLAAAARTPVVSSHGGAARNRRLGARKERARFPIGGQDGKSSPRECRSRTPLAERDAVAEQLAELHGASDRVRKGCGKIGQFRLGDDAAEVVEAVEAERQR